MKSTQKKILFIINPLAGTDRVKALEKDILKALDSATFDIAISYTKYAGHGKTLAEQAVREGFAIVVAVGGDGSVNEVIGGLYGSEIALGIIPLGSGNGLARGLNIPIHPQKALQLINRMKFREIKLGKANEHIFASTIGVGFDQVVTRQFEHAKKRGFFTYILIILKNFFTYRPQTWMYELDRKKLTSTAFLFNICNSNQLGYNFRLTAHPVFEENYFSLFRLKKFPLYLMPWIALRAFMGTLHRSKYANTKKIKFIRITHPNLKYFQVDGECKPCSSSLQVSILPKKLKIIVSV